MCDYKTEGHGALKQDAVLLALKVVGGQELRNAQDTILEWGEGGDPPLGLQNEHRYEGPLLSGQ